MWLLLVLQQPCSSIQGFLVMLLTRLAVQKDQLMILWSSPGIFAAVAVVGGVFVVCLCCCCTADRECKLEFLV